MWWLDWDERWDRVFSGLKEAAQIAEPDEMDVYRAKAPLASVGLIQPFNWMAWNVPFPRPEDIPSLSLPDCVRQVTRLVRAERTQEGVLWAAIRSGALLEICQVAAVWTDGQVVPPISTMAPQS